jgi:hypothetical protein
MPKPRSRTLRTATTPTRGANPVSKVDRHQRRVLLLDLDRAATVPANLPLLACGQRVLFEFRDQPFRSVVSIPCFFTIGSHSVASDDIRCALLPADSRDKCLSGSQGDLRVKVNRQNFEANCVKHLRLTFTYRLTCSCCGPQPAHHRWLFSSIPGSDV